MPAPDPSPDPRGAESGCNEGGERIRPGHPGRGERSRSVSRAGPVISVAIAAAVAIAAVPALAALETAVAARLGAGRDEGQGCGPRRRWESGTFHGVIFASGFDPRRG